MLFYLFNDYNPFYDFSGDLKNWEHNFVGRASYYGDIGLKGLAYALLPVSKIFYDQNLQFINFYSYIFFIIYIFYIYDFSINFLSKKKKYIRSLTFFFLLANPIILGELTTFYVDQYISFVLFMLFYIFLKSNFSSHNNLEIVLIFLVSFLGSVMKLNGLFFINLFLFFILIFLILKKKYNYLKKYIIFGFIYALTVLIVNFNPLYNISNKLLTDGFKFSNILREGDTILWPGKEEYLKRNNRFQLFLDSNLSATQVDPIYHPNKIDKLKKFIAVDEFKVLAYNYIGDVRTGTFGPFFGILLIPCILYFFYSFLFVRNKIDFKIHLILGFTLISIFLIKYPVFGRHYPHLYFFNIFTFLLFIEHSNFKMFFERFMKNLFLIFIILNSLLLCIAFSIKLPALFYTIHKENSLTQKIINEIDDEIYVYNDNWHGSLIQKNFLNENFNKKLIKLDLKTFNSTCNISYNYWRLPTKICLQLKKDQNYFNQNKYCEIEKKINYLFKIYNWDWPFIRKQLKTTEDRVC
jgi:hypothetical protein